MAENLSYVKSRRGSHGEVSAILTRFLQDKRDKGVDISSLADLHKRNSLDNVRVKLTDEKEMALSLLLAGLPESSEPEGKNMKAKSKAPSPETRAFKTAPTPERHSNPVNGEVHRLKSKHGITSTPKQERHDLSIVSDSNGHSDDNKKSKKSKKSKSERREASDDDQVPRSKSKKDKKEHKRKHVDSDHAEAESESKSSKKKQKRRHDDDSD